MDEAARVRHVDALMQAKSVLVKARTSLLQATAEAIAHAESIESWVERDGPMRWEAERRRAGEALAAAKGALYRKEVTPAVDGGKVSVVDERKAVQRAQARLERAEQALRRMRALRADATREIGLLKAGLAPLGSWIDVEAPAAVARVNRMAESLARYMGDEVDLGQALDAIRKADAEQGRGDGESSA